MTGTFASRIDELIRQVGYETIQVRWTTDQVYAKYQELREDLRHPRGGRAHYVRDALLGHVNERMERMAACAVVPSGSDLVGAAISTGVENMHQQAVYTPREFLNLARSVEIEVTDDGKQVYHRPPDVPRLSEADLKRQRQYGNDLDFGSSTNPRLG